MLTEIDRITLRTKARISHTERAWQLQGDLATLDRATAAKRLTEALTAVYDQGVADARGPGQPRKRAGGLPCRS